jgi:asparagine synthase (glutamine-hydrolysing)
MCGIFGEFGRVLSSKNQFMQLNELSFRRGPDMSGYWTNDEMCQLGFNRLSILDLSTNGNQPMISNNGNLVMIMNGEIYNYLDIKKMLDCKPDTFMSQTDAEVLLTAFKEWGINKTLEIINGIFAIALFDINKKSLHLIRDFAGVKPLYFGIKEKTMVFASQYDQIFGHPLFKDSKVPNENNLYDFIQFGYIQAPNAFFKNTWQVEPGQVISFDKNLEIYKRTFYEFSTKENNINEMDKSTICDIDINLKNTVSNQLMSDVPVGSFLSGGIDSPLITYYAKQSNPQIQSYTIGSHNSIFDESDIAAKYADFLNIKNHQHSYSNKTLINDIDGHFKAYSEPFGDYSSLPSFQICKMAKDYFSVILSGDGGDEIFWGYPRFLKYSGHFSWFKFGSMAKKIGGGFARKIGYNISYGIHLQDMGQWVMDGQSYNSSEILKGLIPHSTNSDFIKRFYQFPKHIRNRYELLTWLRWNEYYGHLQRILLKMDRASMYHSIEVRVPFLDKNILDYALKIKPELSINHKSPKYLLKQLMSQKYPMYSINNKKRGFSIDIDNSLRTILKDEIYDLLLSRDPYPANTFNRDFLHKYITSYFEGNNRNEWGIWILYSLQKWAQSFNIDK